MRGAVDKSCEWSNNTIILGKDSNLSGKKKFALLVGDDEIYHLLGEIEGIWD